MTPAIKKFEEETILLRDFSSSTDLKREIKHRIRNRKALEWQFVNLSSRGSFLCLMFEQLNKGI
jgi:hypothetical protein